ncbi:DUF402 domain-containing protein [Alicyclobacillus fodiniaquatilis]|uniref:DUF402 domain-containing protein n=1 Tax=Alicyclobacillus fodiniaquatilis TaxID=1661150 RepID=A0ABW4JNZ9_9BACL
MNLISLHADGGAHRIWTQASKTSVAHTYLVPPGAPVIEASGEQWSSDFPVVIWFWPSAYFQVCMLLKEDRTDYYCNIITPALFGTEVVFVDLDLDVLINDGETLVVDRDEFEVRKYAYPADWIERAEAATAWLVRAAEKQWGPFQPATARVWREIAKRMSNQVSE